MGILNPFRPIRFWLNQFCLYLNMLSKSINEYDQSFPRVSRTSGSKDKICDIYVTIVLRVKNINFLIFKEWFKLDCLQRSNLSHSIYINSIGPQIRKYTFLVTYMSLPFGGVSIKISKNQLQKCKSFPSKVPWSTNVQSKLQIKLLPSTFWVKFFVYTWK